MKNLLSVDCIERLLDTFATHHKLIKNNLWFCPHKISLSAFICCVSSFLTLPLYVIHFFVSMDIIWQIDIKNPLLYISNAPFSVSLQTKRTFWKTYIEITMFVTKWSVCAGMNFQLWMRFCFVRAWRKRSQKCTQSWYWNLVTFWKKKCTFLHVWIKILWFKCYFRVIQNYT